MIRWSIKSLLSSVLIFLLGASVLLPDLAHAELRSLYRGARATAMGGAFVGLADDEQAVFYNPAAMAGVMQPAFHYAIVDMEVSSDGIVNASTLMSAFSNFNIQTINALMGTNAYARAQITPTLLIPNFGLSLISDGQAAIYAKNQALPAITLGYQTTNGVQAAYGFSLGAGRRRKRTEFRLGIGAKFLFRRGGYRSLSTTQLLQLQQNGSGRSLLSQIAGDFGYGIGFDLGTQYITPIGKKFKLSLGAAYTDIGGTTFSSGADKVEGNLSVGAAGQFEVQGIDFTIAYDYRNILDDTDWRLRNHLGLEIKIPMIELYAGWGQTYLSYGVGFNLWIMKITALSYGEELATFAKQDSDRRYLLRLDFKFSP